MFLILAFIEQMSTEISDKFKFVVFIIHICELTRTERVSPGFQITYLEKNVV